MGSGFTKVGMAEVKFLLAGSKGFESGEFGILFAEKDNNGTFLCRLNESVDLQLSWG
jgi:hypothetical protein